MALSRTGFADCVRTHIFVASAFKRTLRNRADAHLKAGATRSQTEFTQTLQPALCFAASWEFKLDRLKSLSHRGLFDHSFPPASVGRSRVREP